MERKILEELAAEKRRAYKRQWNSANRDKVKEHVRRYWEKKVLNEMGEKANDASGKH
jgi:hypothetical protein